MKQAAAKKVLIMAGGTGGHVFPALSIAETLLAEGFTVEWLGTRQGLEARIIGGSNIPIHYISVSGLRGKGSLRKLTAPFMLLVGLLQAFYRIVRIRPACVLGMGGYVTGPGGLAAFLLRRKLLIHEQNAIAGFSNQLLLPLAHTAMEGFSGAFARKHKLGRSRLLKAWYRENRALHVGNPVRASLYGLADPEQRYQVDEMSRRKLRLLVLGGSLGARAINQIIPEMLAALPVSERPDVLHQCGTNNIEQTRASYRQYGLDIADDIRLTGFIEAVDEAYGWADLVICRAGALTVSEIAMAGIASVLVPYPHAVDDHQTANAQVLQSIGAAWIVPQKELTAERLTNLMQRLIADRNLLRTAALLAKRIAKPGATKQAAGLCMEACHV